MIIQKQSFFCSRRKKAEEEKIVFLSSTLMDSNLKASRDEIFEKEFLPHLNSLYYFALKLTGDEEMAQDLVQETFLRALRFYEKYEVGTNARAWLFKMMKNLFINEFRREKRQPQRVDIDSVFSGVGEEEEEQTPPSTMVVEEASSASLSDEVAKALASLPVEFRTILILADVEQFTYEEIATILDMPIGTVRSRLHRARHLLREKLLPYVVGGGYDPNQFKDKDPESSQ